jgi:trk system potassium uptake protein TrkH
VRTTALILYCIYIALTLVQFVCLLIAKMDVFSAINTAFATAGTGGFAIKNSGMDGYSPAIQIIVTVFMLVFSINFNSYYLLIRGKLKDTVNSEVKWFLLIVFVAIGAITLNVRDMFGTTGEALRHSAFTVASIISTTGFATKDFNLWPELSRMLIVIIMFVGACAGSTGGGFKVSRFIILFKGMAREIRRTIHPKKIELVSIDSRPVENKTVMAVGMYLVCYIAVFVVSVILLAPENSGLVTSFTAVTSCLNNIGPGLDLVGPTSNFGFFSPFSKIVLIFDMLAGRLELFPILILFAPATWKK